jgi:hypothetical protein
MIPFDVSPPSGTLNMIVVPSGLTVAVIGAAFIEPEVEPEEPGLPAIVHVTEAFWRFVPVTVIAVPRAPDAGETLVIVGAARLFAIAEPPTIEAAIAARANMVR